MKQGKTLVELAQEIERQRVAKKDYIADTRTVSLHSEPLSEKPELRLVVPQGDGGVLRLPVRELAHKQIGERLGIPARYYDRMRQEAPELLTRNVNTWMQANPERRLIRTLDDEVRAFLSDRYARIDNFDVAEVVLPILSNTPGITIRSCEVTESRLYIKATSTRIAAPVRGSKRVGDIVEAGVMITNSEVGLGALSVKPFLFFLVCTNGMVRDSVLRAAHLGRKQDAIDGLLSDETRKLEDRTVLMKVRDVLKAAMDAAEFQKAIEKMEQQLTERVQGDPAKAIELLGESSQLADGEKVSILRHLIDGGDLSRFGMMNAVTRSAADAESYDRATELETLGGRVLDLPAQDWKRIAQAA
jgi:uncharacterized protein YeeX (DUF496 family)